MVYQIFFGSPKKNSCGGGKIRSRDMRYDSCFLLDDKLRMGRVVRVKRNYVLHECLCLLASGGEDQTRPFPILLQSNTFNLLVTIFLKKFYLLCI